MRELTKQELRARVLALVLAAVLVWYTAVVPSGAPAARVVRPRRREDGEGRGGESRSVNAGAAAADGGAEAVPIEDLDWPEFICLD